MRAMDGNWYKPVLNNIMPQSTNLTFSWASPTFANETWEEIFGEIFRKLWLSWKTDVTDITNTLCFEFRLDI